MLADFALVENEKGLEVHNQREHKQKIVKMKQDPSGRRVLAAPFSILSSVKMIIIILLSFNKSKILKQIESPVPIRGGASAVLLTTQ